MLINSKVCELRFYFKVPVLTGFFDNIYINTVYRRKSENSELRCTGFERSTLRSQFPDITSLSLYID